MVKRKFTLKTMLWNKCNGYNQNIKSSNFIENVLHTFTHSRIQPHLFTLHYCLLNFVAHRYMYVLRCLPPLVLKPAYRISSEKTLCLSINIISMAKKTNSLWIADRFN